MSAPVRHTCPDIDKVIAAIREARKLLSLSQSTDEIGDCKDYASYADDELYRLDDILEELRESNDALRNWGHDCEERITELEAEINTLIIP